MCPGFGTRESTHKESLAVGLAILGNQFIVILYLRHAARIRFHFFSLLDY